MKKHALLTLLPFALVVTGCGSLNKSSIFNAKFLQMNSQMDFEEKYDFEIQKDVVLDLGADVTPTQHASQDDILVLSKADGSKGFYSLTTRKIVVPVDAWKDSTINFTVSTGEYHFRFFYASKVIEEKEVLSIYDEYGNLVYNGETGSIAITGNGIDDIRYGNRSRVEIYISGLIKSVAFYGIDHSFKEVFTYEDYLKKNPYDNIGDSLSWYGHPELVEKSVINNNEKRYSEFNTKKGKYVASFAIPSNTSGKVIRIGDYFYYQIKTAVHEREKSYDYAVGAVKYKLETFRVNYTNGKVSKIKSKLIFETFDASSQNLMDVKGNAKYYYAFNVIEIVDKAQSQTRRGIILDENLSIKADVTGIDMLSLKRVGDNFLIGETLYDSKLREVGYINNINDYSVPRVVNVGDLYGLVDSTGKYLIDPVHEYIDIVAGGKEYYDVYDNSVSTYYHINEKEKLETIATFNWDEYSYDSQTASLAHTIYERNEDHKFFAFSRIDGSFTPVFVPQTGDVNICFCEFEYAIGNAYCTDAVVYQRGSEYRAVFNSTHITYSLPSFFPTMK